MKTISVIILSHNNKGISICLQAVLDQLCQNDEVIVVDDHSEQAFWDKELSAYQKHQRVRICQALLKRGNRSYNRNLGAQQSKKDILLFLDGDMIPVWRIGGPTHSTSQSWSRITGYITILASALPSARHSKRLAALMKRWSPGVPKISI